MRIKIEETDSMYILYNPEKDINPEVYRYKNISEAINIYGFKKTKAISDFFLIKRLALYNQLAGKYLYASDNKLYPDTNNKG